MYCSRRCLSSSRKRSRTWVGASLHILDSSPETWPLLMSGLLLTTSLLLSLLNARKDEAGRRGAVGFFALGTLHGPAYAAFSRLYLSLSARAISSYFARSCGGRLFQASATCLATSVARICGTSCRNDEVGTLHDRLIPQAQAQKLPFPHLPVSPLESAGAFLPKSKERQT